MTEAELLAQHVDLLFDTDGAGRLVRVNEDEGDPAPRLFLVRGRVAHLIAVRAGMPVAMEAACREIAAGLPAWDGRPSDPRLFEGLRDTLAGDTAVEDETIGPAFRFPEATVAPSSNAHGAVLIADGNAHLLERHFPYTRVHLDHLSPVVGVVVDGAVVAACYAARSRPSAAEAGVFTEAPHRGRGFAVAVVQGWCTAVEHEGRMPLYSTSWDNTASLAVARRLGLMPYAETISLV
ncbi:MAG TPA: GNAT family N-acetyltransferase [Candidatus Limnocylindrales bacterium]